MNISRKQYRAYGILLALTGFGFAMVWYAILPLQKTVLEYLNQSQQKAVDREIRQSLSREIDSFRSQKEFVTKRQNRLDTVIAKGNIVRLIEELETIAKETNNAISIVGNDQITLSSKKATKKKDGEEQEKSLLENLPDRARIGMSVTVSGDWASILRFLQKMESMRYQTDVLAIGVSFEEKTASSSDRSRPDIFSDTTQDLSNPEASDSKKDILRATLDTIVYVRE